MKYYAFIDGEQKGPFELDRMVAEGVRPSTYIWCKDMDDWQQAREVPEVCRLFRQHLAGVQHPTTPTPQSPNTPTPQHLDTPTSQHPDTPTPQSPDSPELEDIPMQYRRFVRKSGTTPGPSNDLSPDLSQPPQVSLTLAILAMFLCFIPTGIVAVIFSYKAQKTWIRAQSAQGQDAEEMKRLAHDYGRQGKMWIGITVSLGLIFLGFLFSQNFKY